ncbi:NAD dependent epimerase/dehydratase family protein [Lipomyces chichibuensis]|uniref:NAD dependent epimerase/dehydratase family protein n=1 Tax=Lipomyces chichibuensis TaxID=1546026 RepID=UPI003342F0A1
MRVFVTGATGFIGSAIVQELISAGHEVLGLARSDAAAETLKAAGAAVHRGSLSDLDSLRRGVATVDGVIHAAFIHDFEQYGAACETDRQALETIGEAIAGSDRPNRPFVVTCTTFMLPFGRLATEDSPGDPGLVSPRAASEKVAMSFSSRGVRVSVVRLPPTVHGDGDHAFVPALINIARTKGISAYIVDGANRWPAVHRLDAALLYRLALERAPSGSFLHAVADEGVTIRDIATVISKRLKVPLVSISLEEAGDHFGWMALFVPHDNPTSSSITRELLGWGPVQPSLLSDLDRNEYFESSAL